VYAATSAGVAHAVTEACSAGNLTECSCDSSADGPHTGAPDGWKWGGCSDNVRYGLWFSESFVDAPERDRQRSGGALDVRALMNLHNNEVGRKVCHSRAIRLSRYREFLDHSQGSNGQPTLRLSK